MDLEFWSTRTGIPTSRLREVLDRHLVPERTWMVDEFSDSHPELLDPISAVLAVSAVCLLDAGYRHDCVQGFLAAISRNKRCGRNPLDLPIIADVVTNYGTAKVQLADGRYVRWITDEKVGDWLDSASPSPLPTDLTPMVVVELNLSVIRDKVMG